MGDRSHEMATPEQRAAHAIVMKRYRQRTKEARRAQRKLYLAANAEKTLAAKAAWRKANPDRIAESNQAYRAKYADRIREYERQRAYKRRWLVQAGSSASLHQRLTANEIFTAANCAVSSSLPAYIRDDVISEMVLAILEGRLIPKDAKARVGEFLTAYYRLHPVKFGPISLDEPVFEGGPALIERISEGMWM